MSFRYVDIHTHVHFEAFKNDAEETARRALDEGVWMIQVGTDLKTSSDAIAFSEKFEKGVYATVGLHPIHTEVSFHDKQEYGEGDRSVSGIEVFNAGTFKKLTEKTNVVAIGECGLDYYRLGEGTKEKQKEVFIAQIHLANETKKPLMLHIRNAYKDAYDIVKSEARGKGNVHFFAGTWEEAKWFLDLDFTLSFTGVITFTKDYDEVIRNAPLDMIMSETDAPYVSPVPHRGKRNEPLFVKEVVKRIAEIRKEGEEAVTEQLFQNAKRMFALPN